MHVCRHACLRVHVGVCVLGGWRRQETIRSPGEDLKPSLTLFPIFASIFSPKASSSKAMSSSAASGAQLRPLTAEPAGPCRTTGRRASDKAGLDRLLLLTHRFLGPRVTLWNVGFELSLCNFF